MRGEAIRAAVAKAASNDKPSDDEIGLALAEAVDIALAFFTDIGRIAEAAERVGACADGIHPSAFRIVQQ